MGHVLARQELQYSFRSMRRKIDAALTSLLELRKAHINTLRRRILVSALWVDFENHCVIIHSHRRSVTSI